jgi:glutamate racemase
MIGIFDSGCGGLTVLRALRAALPQADVVYFGDTKHAPYGNRTREDIISLTEAAFNLLRSRGATNIVSACNSVSVSLALSVPERVIEMVGPTVRALAKSEKRIGLAATVATIESGIYQDAFRAAGKEATAFSIPELAGAIEAGKDTDEIVANALAGKEGTFDTLILACTHYPLVRESFAKVLPNVELFDPALPVAEEVKRLWGDEEQGTGTTHFILSKESPVFIRFIEAFFPESATACEVLE